MNEVRRKLRVVATAVPQTCLMINWDLEVSLHQDLLNPESQGCHQAKDQSFILCHVVGGLELKVHYLLHLISAWVDEDHTSFGHCLWTDPSKKCVQWGSVKTGVLASGSGGPALGSEPPGLLGEGVHSAMKSARIWLLTTW